MGRSMATVIDKIGGTIGHPLPLSLSQARKADTRQFPNGARDHGVDMPRQCARGFERIERGFEHPTPRSRGFFKARFEVSYCSATSNQNPEPTIGQAGSATVICSKDQAMRNATHILDNGAVRQFHPPKQLRRQTSGESPDSDQTVFHVDIGVR
jgi:hypothetical protein